MASQRLEKESVYVEDLKNEIGVQNEKLGRDVDDIDTRRSRTNNEMNAEFGDEKRSAWMKSTPRVTS
eukprot:7444785-Heterocapsa_arctica.AAC.1